MFNKLKYKLFLENIAVAFLNSKNIDEYYEDILKYIIKTPSKYLLDLRLFKLSLFSFPKIELIENTNKLEDLQIMEIHFNLPHFLLSTFANYKDPKYFRLFLLILIKAQYTTFLFRTYYESHTSGSGHAFSITEDNLINYIITLITYNKLLKTIIFNNLNKIIENYIKSTSVSSSASSSDNLLLQVDFFLKSKRKDKNYDTLKDVLENFLYFNKTKKLNKLYKLKYFKNLLEIDLEHQPYINPYMKYSKKDKQFMKELYPNIFCNAKKICKNKNINSKLSSSIINKIIKS
jgi:hypothetical protein